MAERVTEQEREFLWPMMWRMLDLDSFPGAVNAICDVLDEPRRFPGIEADHGTLLAALADEARKVAHSRGIPDPARYPDDVWQDRLHEIIRERWPGSWAACNTLFEFDAVRFIGAP
jgi:hypothetical protein